MEWPRVPRRKRVAGVNSFGISGTNAHIVVEEYSGPAGPGQPRPTRGPAFRAVRGGHCCAAQVGDSAPDGGVGAPPGGGSCPCRPNRTTPCGNWRSATCCGSNGRNGQVSLSCFRRLSTPCRHSTDMSWTAGVGRSHFDHRAGVVFSDAASLKEGLASVARGGAERAPRAVNKVAFVYTGQGSQWVGMGRDLYGSEPVARAMLDRCEAVFTSERGVSLLDVMFGRPGAEGDLGDTAWEQPALLRAGMRPDGPLGSAWESARTVVLGHSVGELAAAQAAGVFSLEDGMRFATARGALLSATRPGDHGCGLRSAGPRWRPRWGS